MSLMSLPRAERSNGTTDGFSLMRSLRRRRANPPQPPPAACELTQVTAGLLEVRNVDLADAGEVAGHEVILLLTNDIGAVIEWRANTKAALLVSIPRNPPGTVVAARLLDAGADRCLIAPSDAEVAAHVRSLLRRLQPDLEADSAPAARPVVHIAQTHRPNTLEEPS